MATDTAVVEKKSAFASKINWVQVVGFIAMVGSVFGLDIDQDTQNALVAGIAGIWTVVTIIMRTFFTKTVTQSAVPGPSA